MTPYTTIHAATRYQTEDGRWWDTEADANAWHRNLRERDEMNAMLDAGATLGAIAARFPGWHEGRVYGGTPLVPPALADVTAAHRFVIEHWQCSPFPVYAIERFNEDGSVYVGGARGEGRHYGQSLTLVHLARYPVHAPEVSK